MKDDAAGPEASAGDKQPAMEALGQASTHPTVSEMDTLDRKSTNLDDPADAVTTAGPVDGAGVLEDVEPATRVCSGTPYSAFTRGTKVWITVMVTISSVVSPMTANVYYPALNAVASDLGVSISLINLTLTTYMVFQGLSPTIFGDFGDMAGRRPAFIVAFSIYLCANIGLALQRNYAALMVLRCLQSAGSSGTLALALPSWQTYRQPTKGADIWASSMPASTLDRPLGQSSVAS